MTIRGAVFGRCVVGAVPLSAAAAVLQRMQRRVPVE